MKTLIRAAALGAALSLLAPASAADKGTAAEAVAMTQKAIAYIKENGREKAFAEFANPANATFHDRDLYVYVYDTQGVALSHGINPKMVGRNLLELRDGEGKYIVKSFIETASGPAGKGWVEYKWPNPLTKSVDPKAGYVERLGDLIVGSGIYK
ncbi:cache domain-containing protein [Pseudoduganella namucuonensis]|uniref:Single Cache domain 2-containing protein n=1 Tax=Pseudoduganella namucuonensis TaxID=1035707 RepID=A0A1I7KWY9_9BURK|nr:cache domain-containing protein [Pseudoduganella namucuonensis]SFV01969.1 Single Cache domain 2-containing protein [Pseudoduganella namucuonensis]